jgi:TDG/mug DNA glycosylase family protein
VIAPGLKVLFVGINPGLYTAAIGHHFGRPGNRFWPTLHQSGFTPRLLSPFEEEELLKWGYGITNVVDLATANASELTLEKYVAGGVGLIEKVRRLRPRFVAILGIEAYRKAFKHPKAVVGRQPGPMGDAVVWVLPNPSGLNANYQIGDLARVFRELKKAAEESVNHLTP